MTLQDKMENISVRFFELLANKLGYHCWSGKDFGCDLQLRNVAKLVRTQKNGTVKTRYLDSGRVLDIQLKSVKENNITLNTTTNNLHYDAESKTYNDLIQRRDDRIIDPYSLPLLLLVVVFPENFDETIELKPDHLLLRKSIYWYLPNDDDKLTGNHTTKTVHIPFDNLVTLDFFDEIFNNAYS